MLKRRYLPGQDIFCITYDCSNCKSFILNKNEICVQSNGEECMFGYDQEIDHKILIEHNIINECSKIFNCKQNINQDSNCKFYNKTDKICMYNVRE